MSTSKESSASPGPEFDRTANDLEAKYGSASESSATGDGAATPGPEVIPPGEGPHQHYVTPDTVEAFLKLIFDGLAKVHGDHWKLSQGELAVLTPVNVAMVDEQFPKLFGNLANPALVTWALVMGGFIATRSKAGAELIQLLITKLGTMFGGASTKGDSTKAESPAS